MNPKLRLNLGKCVLNHPKSERSSEESQFCNTVDTKIETEIGEETSVNNWDCALKSCSGMQSRKSFKIWMETSDLTQLDSRIMPEVLGKVLTIVD